MLHSIRWIWVFFFAFFLFSIFLLYSFFTGTTLSLLTINSILALTGIFLVGLSFAIGNIAFFFPSCAKFNKHRKEVGLTGFFVVLGHVYLTLFHLQEMFPFPASYLQGKAIFSFTAAVIALAILTMMAAISNTIAMKFLGQWWRKLLRVGYVAFLLALLHMALRETHSWSLYVQNPVAPPPLSILILWFGVYTITLRICVYFMTKKPTS